MKRKKDYKCDSCAKSFTTLQALELHLRTVHDGYKDYKCEYCGKSYTHLKNLKQHKHKFHKSHKE